ncbi:bactericidal permeability-increasing protein-like isoform X2 [Ostrea edulis]|uniref:bactericidal permeability-increasing protein-like isoform X2 n=1 Tax=Ostrea edulis TaxID=37623 RepID=UPI0024AF8C2F|nr:bactericidal permeability-increasing protein-like isoform X2 [Ostrea edulis]
MMGIFGIILTLMGMFVVESYQTEELVHNASYSVVFRLTQTGLTYAVNTILEKVKVQNISAYSFSCVNETTTSVNYYMESLQIIRYTNLNASASFEPDPSSRVNLTVHDLSVELQGKVRCTHRQRRVFTQNCTLKMEIRGSGYFLSHIGRNGGMFKLRMVKKDCHILPSNITINFTECDESVESESLCNNGSSDFIEQFRENRIGEAKLCLLLTFFINFKENKEMEDIDLLPAISKIPFGANLSMTKDPKYTNEYIETYHEGGIFWLSTGENYNVTPIDFTLHNDSSKMVYLWVSKSVTESFFEGIQIHGMLHYLITAQKVGSGLNTTCTKGVCVGRLVPELGKKFPKQYMDLEVYSIKNPTVKFQKNLAILGGKMVMFASIRDPISGVSFVIAKLTGEVQIQIKVNMRNLTLHGEVVSFEPSIEDITSPYVDFNSQTVNFILTGAVVVAIEPRLNALGSTGITLPVPKIELYNTTIDLIENAIVLGSDVEYIER